MHTSCISEAERYEKTAAKPKKAKRNPQQEWMDIVETCASSAPCHLRDHLLAMSNLDNIPRKEKQFVNFASNSLKLRGSNKSVVNEIWSHLRQERERRIAEKEKNEKIEKEKQQPQEKAAPHHAEEEKIPSEKVVPNLSENEKFPSACSSNTHENVIDKKKLKKITKRALKKAPNRSMRMKELRKILKKELGLPKITKKQLNLILIETAETSKNRIKIDGKLMSVS